MNPHSVRQRASNFELLRLLSMLLVLVVHADFWSIGRPTPDEILVNPFTSSLRYFVEALAIVCVNIFILISGWFGIRPTMKKFLSLLFQVGFILLVSFLFWKTIVHGHLSMLDTIKYFLLLNHLWFVKAYLGLFILAPVLNTFIENATRRQHETVILVFFLFQCYAGWIYPVVDWFVGGYSLPSFILLYLLAAYLRKYPNRWTKLTATTYLLIFMGVAIFVSAANMLPDILGIYILNIGNSFYAYNSPTTILAAVCLLLAFKQLPPFTNRAINYLASSTFAIYLFHANHLISIPCYKDVIKQWFETLSGWQFLGHTTLLILLGCSTN